MGDFVVIMVELARLKCSNILYTSYIAIKKGLNAISTAKIRIRQYFIKLRLRQNHQIK